MKIDIAKRCGEIMNLAEDAERCHIDVMVKIGKLILEVKEDRGYKSLENAQNEVSLQLKLMNSPIWSTDYVEACRRLHTKLSQAQRNMVRRYALSRHDIVILTQLSMEKVRDCLEKIRTGVYLRRYTTNGSSYRIVEIYRPAVAKRRGIRKRDGREAADAMPGLSVNPDVLSAKVMNNGLFNAEALTDLYAHSISRFPTEFMKCWQDALIRVGANKIRSAS